ncbi:hypothetical protein A2U01_0069948, partial [Trifolium medium]|nr:hypothetical protein [Trifolium medium]
PHLVSPSPVVEDSSCFEISRPYSTPTMCMDLDPSELDDDVGPMVCEVTSRARALLRVHVWYAESILVVALLRNL